MLLREVVVLQDHRRVKTPDKRRVKVSHLHSKGKKSTKKPENQTVPLVVK